MVVDHVNKYEIDWQITRVSVKGQKVKLDDKLAIVKKYFEANKTHEAHERVVNWLGGLARGYKAAGNLEAIDTCIETIAYYEDNYQNLPKEKFDHVEQKIKTSKYSYAERLLLWKDLFKYQKDFSGRGYRHKELEAMIDLLWDIFRQKGEDGRVADRRLGYEHIRTYRSQTAANKENPKNKKRFFF